MDTNDVAKDYLRRLADIDERLLTIRMDAARDARSVHQDKKVILDEAKAAHGIAKKVMNQLWAEQRLRTKLAKVGEDLEGDDAEQHEALRAVFGDLVELPLFEAAAEADERKPAPKASGRKKKSAEAAADKGAALDDLAGAGPSDDLPDLRPRFLQDREAERGLSDL